jgi:hypothetical protein
LKKFVNDPLDAVEEMLEASSAPTGRWYGDWTRLAWW